MASLEDVLMLYPSRKIETKKTKASPRVQGECSWTAPKSASRDSSRRECSRPVPKHVPQISVHRECSRFIPKHVPQISVHRECSRPLSKRLPRASDLPQRAPLGGPTKGQRHVRHGQSSADTGLWCPRTLQHCGWWCGASGLIVPAWSDPLFVRAGPVCQPPAPA